MYERCLFVGRCVGWSRQPSELSGRDRGRHGDRHRVVGQRPQDLELGSPAAAFSDLSLSAFR